MSESKVEVSGIEEILDNLERLNVDVEKQSKKALLNASKIVEKELQRQSPYDYEGKIHMKDHVVSSRVKRNRETGDLYVSVGYPKGIKHRVHIVEFGTINQAPQHFMSDTIKNTEKETLNVIAKTLREALY
ncbi:MULTISPECIES: HK97-gp10 family putative phage morphogenesis protein [Staphylococcaceae]|uniref:HK97 gp10 family phage protein n=1 Tax=Macrococcus caseolyticus (strain JCSC5402) TaxID=458233 RepID=B9E7R0_MACCJ|nr:MULTISPECIES: HK97-gp10 family putative phage morphogenesis protein [Macrococcus]ARQ04397.1 hypothetical protein CA207_11460 [Macrococcus caseolyticus]MDJ1108598.1 HK97 gp10 family phage protein [Macrococcus caseolyticus]PKE13242.1 hypothetical protein CW685_00510 [Macrococcus caseolyticus]QQB05861.1 HK97 gp10 family phage protein [Macrococcus caseolyticus]UBH12424.1 HK97 gp10 family phage protein [Macrococcus armenti]